MKKLVLFSIIVFSLISCSHQEVNNDWKFLNLKGKVQSIKYETYEASVKFGKVEQGELEATNTYEFNKDGFLISSSTVYDDVNYRRVYTYNGDTVIRTIYSFDTLYQKVVSVYNAQRLLLKETTYDSFGKIIQSYTYKYQDKQLTEVLEYCEDGILCKRKSDYVYKNGKLKSYCIYNEDGLYETDYFKYDNKGRVTDEKDVNSDGEVKFRQHLEYDKYGNLMKVSFKDWYYQYEKVQYDSFNNVIKSVISSDDSDYEILHASITYF